MIQFITVEDALPLRNVVLREGKLTPDECRFPSDNLPGNFHLGYFDNEKLVCIASFHPQSYGEYRGRGLSAPRNGDSRWLQRTGE